MGKYTAASLDEIAQHFEMLASDQLAFVSRAQTKREKDACKIRAEIWQDAANTLRETTIEPTP